MAVIFAIGGILIQIGITFLENPVWASVGNLIYITLLGIAIMNIPDVMHPSSPILESDATRIQLFFFSLLAATLLMAGALAGLLRNYEGRFR
jgi:zinc transporter ZupT